MSPNHVSFGTVDRLGSFDANPSDIGFFGLIREDFETHGKRWFSEGFWTLFWHRFGNWRMGIQPRLLRLPFSLLYRTAFLTARWVTGIELPYTVRVGRRVHLEHFGGMVLIAESIGDDTVVRHNTTFGIARMEEPRAWPVIGKRVDIGTGAVIIGKVHVGDDATIGANAVVVKDVPVGAVVGGVPAKIIRRC